MKQYKVKGIDGYETFLKITEERKDGFMVNIISIRDERIKEREEFIGRHLFDVCIRTGYFQEVSIPEPVLQSTAKTA